MNTADKRPYQTLWQPERLRRATLSDTITTSTLTSMQAMRTSTIQAPRLQPLYMLTPVLHGQWYMRGISSNTACSEKRQVFITPLLAGLSTLPEAQEEALMHPAQVRWHQAQPMRQGMPQEQTRQTGSRKSQKAQPFRFPRHGASQAEHGQTGSIHGNGGQDLTEEARESTGRPTSTDFTNT